MKYLKYLSALTAVIFLSTSVFAAPAVFESQLKLTGFSGGQCNINVAANANASNLNLDIPQFNINVGTVNTACDHNHRIVASLDTSDSNGALLLTHQNGFETVPLFVRVDGQIAGDPTTGEIIVAENFIGNSSNPIFVDVDFLAPVPGIYQGTVTFSVIVD